MFVPFIIIGYILFVCGLMITLVIASECDSERVLAVSAILTIVCLITAAGLNLYGAYVDKYDVRYVDKNVISITKQDGIHYKVATDDGSSYTVVFDRTHEDKQLNPNDINIVTEGNRIRIYNYKLRSRDYELYITKDTASVFEYKFTFSTT